MSEAEQGALVPVDVFNAITEYLSSRPYKEVFRLIEELRAGTKIIEVPAETTEEKVDD